MQSQCSSCVCVSEADRTEQEDSTVLESDIDHQYSSVMLWMMLEVCVADKCVLLC
jgi:hypothetical protein